MKQVISVNSVCFLSVRSIFQAILFTVCYATERLTVETPLVVVVGLRLRRRRIKSIMCSFKNKLSECVSSANDVSSFEEFDDKKILP